MRWAGVDPHGAQWADTWEPTANVLPLLAAFEGMVTSGSQTAASEPRARAQPPVPVGTRLRVWWVEEQAWFSGTVKGYTNASHLVDADTHLVVYDDGDQQHEPLGDASLRWELEPPAQADGEVSSGARQSHAAQQSGTVHKRPRDDKSPHPGGAGKARRKSDVALAYFGKGKTQDKRTSDVAAASRAPAAPGSGDSVLPGLPQLLGSVYSLLLDPVPEAQAEPSTQGNGGAVGVNGATPKTLMAWQDRSRRERKPVGRPYVGTFDTSLEAAVAVARAANQAAKAPALEHGEEQDEEEEEEERAEAAAAPTAGHKRPRGRAPAGKVWNGATGRWDALQTALAVPSAPAALIAPAKMYGTFGCDLPDRHSGLHHVPTVGAARKRRASMLKLPSS